MPASQAQILANQANALKSTGPRTAEGKAVSRCNAVRHGLTGEGVALSNEDAAEVERRFSAIQSEMRPSGEVGRALLQRFAVLSVRCDRAVLQETVALSDRVRQAEADYQAPEGLDVEAVAGMRAEAGRRAMFDPSKAACLARKYEASAERGMFRALKEFRQVEREAKVAGISPEARETRAELASFSPAESMRAKIESKNLEPPRSTPPTPVKPILLEWEPLVPRDFDLPFTVGKAR